MQRKLISQKPVPDARPQHSDIFEARSGLTSDDEVLAEIFESIEQSVEDDFLYGEPVGPDAARPSPATVRSMKLNKAGSNKNKPRRSAGSVLAKRIKRLLSFGDAQ